MVILHRARLVLGWVTHHWVDKPSTAKLSNTSGILCGITQFAITHGLARQGRAQKLNHLNGPGSEAYGLGCKRNYTRNLHIKQVITRK